MIEEILRTRKKKHTQDLNIVPILDMLTTVIFFLLMSTSFIEYTKVTVPPAGTSTSKSESRAPPVAPKLAVNKLEDDLFLVRLTWGGASPGHSELRAPKNELLDKVREQVSSFSTNYPLEKTLQISMGREVPYQVLIIMMDAARDHMPDPVLSSYTDAEGK
jgi:biopolymer transport protein ExbD